MKIIKECLERIRKINRYIHYQTDIYFSIFIICCCCFSSVFISVASSNILQQNIAIFGLIDLIIRNIFIIIIVFFMSLFVISSSHGKHYNLGKKIMLYWCALYIWLRICNVEIIATICRCYILGGFLAYVVNKNRVNLEKRSYYKYFLRKIKEFRSLMGYITTFIMLQIINLLLLYLMDFNYNNEIVVQIVLIFLFLLNLIMCFIINVNVEYDKISIKFVNLSQNEFLEKAVYLDKPEYNNKNNYKIYELDISEVFPDEATNISYYIRNKKLICTKDVGDVYLNNSSKKIYFVKAITNHKFSYLYFDLIVHDNNVNKHSKISFYVDFEKIHDDDIPINIKIVDIHRCWIYSKKQALLNKKAYYIKDFDYTYLVVNNYIYNDLSNHLENNVFSNVIYDHRKWLFNDGKFGSGKTSLSIVATSEMRMKPVIISVWEENFNHDYLYLIFKKLKKATKKRIFFTRQGFIFYFILLSSIIIMATPFIIKADDNSFIDIMNILKSYEILKNMDKVWLYVVYLLVVLGIIMIFTYFIFVFIQSNIIMFQKNHSFYYQDFFLESINKMLMQSNAVLVMEDVDRLDVVDIKKLFSVLSAINNYCNTLTRFIGIITFDKQRLYDLLKDEFENLENKCLHHEVFDQYDSQESMEVYLEAILKYLCFLYNISINDLEYIVKEFDYEKYNFRSIKDFLFTVLDACKEQQDIEEIRDIILSKSNKYTK